MERVNINARNGEIMNFGVLNDYSEPAADRFPVQVLKQQAPGKQFGEFQLG